MSSPQQPHVAVEAGPGLVARFGESVVVIGSQHDNDEHESFTNTLLAALDAAGTTRPAPDRFAWQLAGLVAQYRDAAPAFAVARRIDDAYLLFLHGAVRALVAGGAAEVELSGRTALTWIDRVVEDPVTSVTLTLSVAGAVQTDPRSDLRGGLVPGGGLVLTLADDAAEPVAAGPVAAEPVAAPDQATGPQSGSEPAPDPVAAPDEASPPALAGADLEQTTTLAALPAEEDRPGFGVLVADDGQRIPLDRGYVLGREPQYEQAVVSGQAAALVVADGDNLISRVQAYLWVDADGVHLRDASSANGTFVAAPGASDWVRLSADDALLPVGWSLRMGRRVYTHLPGQHA